MAFDTPIVLGNCSYVVEQSLLAGADFVIWALRHENMWNMFDYNKG